MHAEHVPGMVPVPPPAGVAIPKASLWCGAWRCPRVVVETRSRSELDRAEREWRCPKCGRSAVYSGKRNDRESPTGAA